MRLKTLFFFFICLISGIGTISAQHTKNLDTENIIEGFKFIKHTATDGGAVTFTRENINYDSGERGAIGGVTYNDEEVRIRQIWKFNLPDTDIPDEATITDVHLRGRFISINHIYETLSLTDFKDQYDLMNDEELWQWAITYAATASQSIHYNTPSTKTIDLNDPDLITAIQDALERNYFVFNLRIADESAEHVSSIDSGSLVLEITYTLPNFNLPVTQKYSTGQQFGSIAHWEDEMWWNVSSGYTGTFELYSKYRLKASTNTSNGERFHNWNEGTYQNFGDIGIQPDMTEVSAQFSPSKSADINVLFEGIGIFETGDFEFEDPWKYFDTETKYGYQNKGTNENDFEPYSGSSSFNIFLDQNFSNLPHYRLKLSSDLRDVDINGLTRDAFLFSVDGTNASVPSNEFHYSYNEQVVFTDDNAAINVTYKTLSHTNASNVFNNSMMKKAIEVNQGGTRLHYIVYESLGKVWYEEYNNVIVTDDPLGTGKNPAIVHTTNFDDDGKLLIVFESAIDGDRKLHIVGLVADEKVVESIVDINDNSAYDAKPNIALAPSGIFEVVYRDTDENGNWGLNYLIGDFITGSSSSIDWKMKDANNNPLPAKVLGTDETSENPTIAISQRVEVQNYFHIAWQQEVEKESQILYYWNMYQNSNSGRIYTKPSLDYPSDGRGFNENVEPTLVALAGDDYPRLVWRGIIPNTVERLVLRGKPNGWYSNTWNSSDFKFGYSVDAGTITGTDDGNYIISWSESSTNRKSYVTNYSFSQIKNYKIDGNDIVGKQLQVTNGATINSPTAFVLNDNSQPYSLIKSNISTTKVNGTQFANAMEGNIVNPDGHFYVRFGDINSNDEIVSFKELGEFEETNTIEKLNRALTSKSFSLAEDDVIRFNLQFGLNSTESIEKFFNENGKLDVVVQLIDIKSGEIMGSLKHCHFDVRSNISGEVLSYEISTNSVSSENAALRVCLDKNFDASIYASQLVSNTSLIGKESNSTIIKTAFEEVTEYALAQNYPNPFNPSTTINYQIPEAGIVTIKIFDILGREVTTLVNEQKAQGVYTVNFNAASLASGVYLYNIQVNDYSATRKMILMK